MNYTEGLRCRECRREYSINPIHVCEFCFGPLEVIYDYEKVKKNLNRKKIEERPKSMWRYRELLPVDNDPTIGLLDGVNTKIYGAQASGSNPITSAFKEGLDWIKPQRPQTIAKSLAIGNPADGYYALKTIRESGGWAEDVSDTEIIEGMKLLAQTEGIFTETAGGVTVGVTKKLIEQEKIPRDESILISITGNGLKTQEAIQDRVGRPRIIDAKLSDFEKIAAPKHGERVSRIQVTL